MFIIIIIVMMMVISMEFGFEWYIHLKVVVIE